ncbi:MAG: hypothetical protein ABSD74_15880 [Rhizomicrobium sp.]|jgi:hypothetical protein
MLSVYVMVIFYVGSGAALIVLAHVLSRRMQERWDREGPYGYRVRHPVPNFFIVCLAISGFLMIYIGVVAAAMSGID